MAGHFFQKDIYLTKINESLFIYNTSLGDQCGDGNYTTSYYFINDDKAGKNEVNFSDLVKPSMENDINCNRKIDIKINFNERTEYLLVQRFLNDYWVPTGIIFFLVGLYLLIFANIIKVTKIIICIIFGEIFFFSMASGIFGLTIKYMEWFLFGAGLIVGLILSYFVLKVEKLYHTFLAINAGFLFAIIIFDIVFCHGNYILGEILLSDCLLIFVGTALTIIYLAPNYYHYFGNSIIGSYIFVRGISVLLQKIGKKVRFRELQLVLYLLHKYENPLADYYYKNVWPFYFVYDVVIIILMVVSMICYYKRVINKEGGDINEEDNPDGQLILEDKKDEIDNKELKSIN